MQSSYQVVYIDRNFISDRYPNKPTDGDKFFTYGFASLYARQFKKYNPDIHVECWKADPRIRLIAEKEIEGVYYRMFPSLNFGRFGQYSKQMIRFLKNWNREKTNTIFNISSFDHLLFYSLALKLKYQPLVVQNHGESTALYKTTIKKGLIKIYFILLANLEKLCLRNIDLVYVLDERIKDWLPEVISPNKVKISTTGVDETLFRPIDKIQAKLELGLDINKKYIIYVGRLNTTKHPDMLIDIYTELKKGRKDLELILAGHEKSDPFYIKGKESGALMYGKILQTELYKYLSAACAYVLAKLDESIPFGGIGMLSVQALLCETPIIGSTVAAFPEIDRKLVGIVASDQKSLKNAIVDIIDEEKHYSNLREKALKYYSWKCISFNTATDYLMLLNKSR